MRLLLLQSWMEVRLMLRRPYVIGFSLLLPIVFLLFFGALYGTQSVAGTDITYINYIVPGYAVYAVMTVALSTLVVNLANERQARILKRLGGTPLPRATLVGAKVIAGAFLAAAVIIVLVLF